MSTPQPGTDRKWQTIGIVLVVVAALLLLPLVNDGSRVDVFGLDIPVWLVAFAFYALGVLAGAAAVRSRTS